MVRTEAGTQTESRAIEEKLEPMPVTPSGIRMFGSVPLYSTRTPSSFVTKSPRGSGWTLTGTVTVLAVPAALVTVAVSVPVPACCEAQNSAADASSRALILPSEEGVTFHVTVLPWSEGERRALRKTAWLTTAETSEVDSSMPASSETSRTWTVEVEVSDASFLSVTVIVASPRPTALTRPFWSTVRTESFEDAHSTSPG